MIFRVSQSISLKNSFTHLPPPPVGKETFDDVNVMIITRAIQKESNIFINQFISN